MSKLSIIIPVYNTEKYINKCLESLAKQKMKDFEVIIVNDGSTDNSEKVIKEYINSNKEKFIYEIKYLKKENGGLSSARNFALPHVTGKYIMFFDSDDYLDESLFLNLEKQIDENIELIKFKLTTVKENEEIIEILDGPVFDKVTGEEAYEKLCIDDKFLDVACIYLYNTKFFIENNFKYRDKSYHEDFGLTSLVILKAKSVVSTEEAGYYYLQRENSITKNLDYEKTVKKAKDVLEHYDHMLKTIECYEISEKSKMHIKRYYANTALLKLEPLKGKDMKEYVKELRKRKLYKDIKADSLKQFIKKQLIKISPKLYLKMR